MPVINFNHEIAGVETALQIDDIKMQLDSGSIAFKIKPQTCGFFQGDKYTAVNQADLDPADVVTLVGLMKKFAGIALDNTPGT